MLADLIAILAILLFSIYVLIWLFTHNPREPYLSELRYMTNDGESLEYELPPKGSSADPNITLSIVIPCYNERARLKDMLNEAITYLKGKSELGSSFEILIVDDGSKDNTAEYAIELASEFELKPKILKVVKFEKNRGKGGAVTHGVQHASGSYIIFADADGASKFSDIEKLLNAIKAIDLNNPTINAAVAIGSRAHMVDTDAVVKRSFVRNLLMYGLHTLVFIFGIRDIKDTQCGFKLFNRRAVQMIFPNMHTEGWIFDVEILILAARQSVPVVEIPINWHEVDGSKMDLARDSVKMAIDLVVTRMAYLMGLYREKSNKKKVT